MLPWRACDFKVPKEPFQLRWRRQYRHQGRQVACRSRYRIDRAPRLGGGYPFPAGPLLRGGVAWLGVIQRPGRLAISRVSASVSAVLSARACPLHPMGRVGRCMQRKRWGGEVERTGNGAV